MLEFQNVVVFPGRILALGFCKAVGQLSKPEKRRQESLMLTAQSPLNASPLSVINRVARALHTQSFTRPSRVSTASDKCWPGNEARDYYK